MPSRCTPLRNAAGPDKPGDLYETYHSVCLCRAADRGGPALSCQSGRAGRARRAVRVRRGKSDAAPRGGRGAPPLRLSCRADRSRAAARSGDDLRIEKGRIGRGDGHAGLSPGRGLRRDAARLPPGGPQGPGGSRAELRDVLRVLCQARRGSGMHRLRLLSGLAERGGMQSEMGRAIR